MNNRSRLKIFMFAEGLAVGIFAGVIIAAVRFLLDEADIFRPLWFAQIDSVEKIFVTIAALVFVAIFLTKAINFDKQVAGSGIPQIRAILSGQTSMQNPLRLIALKFSAMILAIGAGMSLGRAGVSVQFGAAAGNFLNRIFFARQAKLNRSHGEIEGEILLTAGAGAGLAAVFGAPLSGVVFCIEDLHRKFTPEMLITTITATVSASAIVGLVFGVRPIFTTITSVSLTVPEILKVPTLEMFTMLAAEPLRFFLYFVLLGIFLGFLGVLFTKAMLFSLDVYDRLKIFGLRRYLIPMLLIFPVGLFLPEVLGCGNVLVDNLLSSNFGLRMVLIFFVGKFLFTMICFGTNAPGGVFLPLLTLGALGGEIFAEAGISLGFFTEEWSSLFVIFGMAAYFAAVVKAPVTGSLLIMELTGQFSYLLTLTIVSGLAFMVSDLCGGEPIFSALLNRSKKSSDE